jgi:hypothetical protein
MMDEATLSLLTGPTSSLVLLLGMSLGLWRFGTQTILPAVKRWVDQHLNQVDELLAQHKADREAWLDSMQDCHSRSEALGSQLDTIERKVGGLYKRHEALVAKLDGLPSVTVNGVPE